MSSDNFLIGCDMTVTYANARYCRTGANEIGLTVTGQAKDSSGNNVGSSFSLTYDADTDGDYVGTLSSDATSLMTESALYTIVITATLSSHLVDTRRLTETAKYHGYAP